MTTDAFARLLEHEAADLERRIRAKRALLCRAGVRGRRDVRKHLEAFGVIDTPRAEELLAQAKQYRAPTLARIVGQELELLGVLVAKLGERLSKTEAVTFAAALLALEDDESTELHTDTTGTSERSPTSLLMFSAITPTRAGPCSCSSSRLEAATQTNPGLMEAA